MFVHCCQLCVQNPAWNNSFGVWVCVCACMHFYFGTWCHCCVGRYKCVTALELTDKSTEPDPGITFGCNTNFATRCKKSILAPPPVQYHITLSMSTIWRQFRGCLLSCCSYCVSASSLCTVILLSLDGLFRFHAARKAAEMHWEPGCTKGGCSQSWAISTPTDVLCVLHSACLEQVTVKSFILQKKVEEHNCSSMCLTSTWGILRHS